MTEVPVTDKLDGEANFICSTLVREFDYVSTWNDMKNLANALVLVRQRYKDMHKEQCHLSGEENVYVSPQVS